MMVASNSTMSWSTTESECFSCARGTSPAGMPSKDTVPSQGLYKPATSFAMVDFPQPESPTSAVHSPGSTCKSKSEITGGPSGE